jgi:ATP-binding cassette, subfamily C, type I secretion system permease/ATPase
MLLHLFSARGPARAVPAPSCSEANNSQAQSPASPATPKKRKRRRRGRLGGASARSLQDAWSLSRPGLAVVFLLTLFANVLKLAIPLYIFQILDRVISSRSVDTLVMLTVMTIIAVVFAVMIEYVRRWLLIRWGAWIEDHFGKQLFVSSIGPGKKRGPSQALRDLADIRQFVSSNAAPAWLDVVFAPAFVLVVYLIHPILAGVVVFSMTLMLVLGLANEWMTRRSRAAARAYKNESRDWIEAAEHNLETVSSLNIADRVAERWQQGSKNRISENLSTKLRGIAVGDCMRLVENCQRIACYCLGIWLALAGSLSVGGVIAAAVLGRIGSSLVRRAMASWRQLHLTRAAYKRVARRLSKTSGASGAIRDNDKPLALVVNGLTHRYREGARPVLRDLNLQLAPGEVLCVLGPSGSGKSTFARLVAGAIGPSSGAIRLGELEISRFQANERQQLIGYQEQDVKLFQASISENISGLRPGRSKAVVAAAKMAAIHNFIMALPSGYETEIGTADAAMAVGERKRLGLARAFFGRPKLIILDEPEANLDGRVLERLAKSIATARDWGAAVVVISQADTFVPLADKVILLGKSSSRARVFDSQDAYQEHLGSRSAGADTTPAEKIAG